MGTNGWIFWCLRDQDGNLTPVDTVWQEYLKRKGEVNDSAPKN